MFRHRHRRTSTFADFINWTDYRWDPSPWPGARASGSHPSNPTPPHGRRYSLVQVILAGLAVLAGVKLMSSLKNGRNRSWIERGAIAVLLLLVASYVTKRAGRRSW